MTTKLIGVRDFRANISAYAKKVQGGASRIIVMNRNKPLFEIKPIEELQDVFDEAFVASVENAKTEVARGEFYTQEEVEKMFGL